MEWLPVISSVLAFHCSWPLGSSHSSEMDFTWSDCVVFVLQPFVKCKTPPSVRYRGGSGRTDACASVTFLPSNHETDRLEQERVCVAGRVSQHRQVCSGVRTSQQRQVSSMSEIPGRRRAVAVTTLFCALSDSQTLQYLSYCVNLCRRWVGKEGS